MSTSPRIYRTYSYDASVRNVSADFIEAFSDEAAIAAVSEMGFGSRCEIWEDTRLVAELGEKDCAA